MVHLPDVRFCAPHSGRHRGRNALALLAGVRSAPPALRLGGRSVRIRPQAAPDRVFAPQHDGHHHEQALPPPPRGRRLRFRLGRPAYADALRHAPARLHARGDSRFSGSHRRCQGGQRGRRGHARTLRPRGPQRNGDSPHGGARPGAG
ncbi:hypothetical protein SDC9_134916 [bioreactor metagenome]|uniref:Uncharacterized protein n=1 Tax=bioreactor metagenome TaxID=1076179 RepID=A0A645DEN2_9ZZZZ